MTLAQHIKLLIMYYEFTGVQIIEDNDQKVLLKSEKRQIILEPREDENGILGTLSWLTCVC
jgi:hypothetical protein